MSQHISIKSIPPRIRYVSDGVRTTYTFPFAIFKASDLTLYLDSTVQQAGSFSVAGVGDSDGGQITLSQPPAAGVIITLARELTIERTTDFQEGGVLRAEALNHELDYQIACQQQIADSLNRSMVLPPYVTDTGVNLTLPIPSAGKAIVWNSSGTNLENSAVAVNALESTIKGYRDEAKGAAAVSAAKADEAAQQAQSATASAATATAQAQLATGKATEAAGKAAEAAAVLSVKADVGLGNLSQSGKAVIAALGVPDYSAAESRTKGTTYTADRPGVLKVYVSGVGSEGKTVINNIEFFNNGNTMTMTYLLPVTTGDTYSFVVNSGYGSNFSFIPYKGVSND